MMLIALIKQIIFISVSIFNKFQFSTN